MCPFYIAGALIELDGRRGGRKKGGEEKRREERKGEKLKSGLPFVERKLVYNTHRKIHPVSVSLPPHLLYHACIGNLYTVV